jgi:sugar/nucleoside kinase (ribokinase family)
MTGNAATGSRLRVAQVITRFMAGAGWVALSGALALDPDCFEVVFIAGEAADDLVTKAREAGHEVVLMPHLRSEIAPADDRRALADLQACLNGFDVVHTHSSKAGALGRTAAHRLEIRRIVHTIKGSRSISSSPGRAGRPISRSSKGGQVHRRLRRPGRRAEAITRRIKPTNHPPPGSASPGRRRARRP